MDDDSTGCEIRNESNPSAPDVHCNPDTNHPEADHASSISSGTPSVQVLGTEGAHNAPNVAFSAHEEQPNPAQTMDTEEAHNAQDAASSPQLKQRNAAQTPDAEKAHNAQNAAPSTKPQQPNQSLFGLRRGKANMFPNPDDYESKYPEDNYGEEMGPNARVWRTYLDEARKADAELIEGWRDTTDAQLVFAGLFSAVVATFVVQTSTALQTDYTQVTASLLFEQNSLLRATANHTSLDNIPLSPLTPDSNPSVSTNDRWINGLWFTSLSVSLVAAFLAVLVKQWMQHYQSVVFGSIQDQVRIRQFRFLGVERWHMPLIINILPILLHIGLLLFFAGLIVFLVPLDAPIAYATVGITAVAYGFYIASNVLPLLYPMCPYKTPLSSLLAAFISSSRALCSIPIRRLRKLFSIPMRRLHMLFHAKPFANTHDNVMAKETNKDGRRALYHMKEAEKGAALGMADELDVESLVWLYSTSSNPTVASVTVQAISGLRFDLSVPARNTLKKVVFFGKGSVEDMFIKTIHDDRHGRLADHDERKVERVLRACHQSGASLATGTWISANDLINMPYDPKMNLLYVCHHALMRPTNLSNEPALSYFKHGNYGNESGLALAYLKSGIYGNGGLNPYIWSVCLRLCQLEQDHFTTAVDRWSYGFRIMDNIVSADYISDLQHAMFLEYFCSLCTPRQAENDTDWGEYSVLKGKSSFRRDKVLPQIYWTLYEALHVFRTHDIPDLEFINDVLPTSLMSVLNHLEWSQPLERFNNLDDVSPVDRDRIFEAAHALRSEIRNLAESDVFCKDAPDARKTLFDVAVSWGFWPNHMPPGKIPWTPNMMDYFLQPFEYRSASDWAFSSFETGDLDAYRFFEERGGLPKMLSYQATRDLYGHWFNCYLDGLKAMGDSEAARKQYIDYLFAPEHFSCVVETFILVKHGDGTFKPKDLDNPTYLDRWVKGLFGLRPPEQYPDAYGKYLDALQRIVPDWDRTVQLLYPSIPVVQDPAPSESPPVNSANKPRWRQFLSRCGELLHLSSSRGKTESQSDPEAGATV